MSLIAGLVRFDGGGLDGVRRAAQALAPRARRNITLWQGACAVLAGDAAASATRDRGPAFFDDGLAVVADARLDNRDELAAATGSAPSATEAMLILSAYLRWGEETPQRLLGDFAFALWDGRQRKLFCARDHVGVRPLVYSENAQGVAVASEIKGILALGGEHRFSTEGMADFLAGIVPERDATWYAGIKRLPPGHAMSVKREGSRVWAYWRPEPPANPCTGDAVEQFEAIFKEAVRTRLAPDAGVFLSGGLDSSAIALTGSSMSGGELPAYSMVFDGATDERPHIEAVLRAGRFQPNFLQADRIGPFDAFDAMIVQQDGLFQAPGLANTMQLYRTAAATGSRIILDGQGGDEAVSHGLGHLKHQAVTGAWGGVWRNASAEAGIYGASRFGIFMRYWMHLGPARQAFAGLHDTRVRLERRLARLMSRPVNSGAGQGLITAAFADVTGVFERQRAAAVARNRFTSEAEQHALVLNGPIPPHALETLDRAAAHAGVEPRYPFWDKRLVELCLSMKPDDKIRDGRTRYTLRQAMEGVLPRSIQRRTDKFDFTRTLACAMHEHNDDIIRDAIADASGRLGAMIDLPRVRAAYKRISAAPARAMGADVQAVWRTTAMSIWMTSHTDKLAARQAPPAPIIVAVANA
ncbi:MAG: asparagine synthase-related protein [Hyphomonadaceae bacterium]